MREVFPNAEPRWLETLAEVALSGESVRMEKYVPATDRWWDVLAFRPKPGQVANLYGDITERKEAEKEARQASERITAILESITDGFLALNRNWHFTYFNETGARMIGMRREDLIGGSLWDLFPYIESTKFHSEYHRAVDTGVPTHFEEYYPEPLNLWLECHFYPSSEGLSVFFRDVTERKRAEAERDQLFGAEQEARDLAEKAVKVRDEFISIAAHELKTPITSLLGFAQVIQKELESAGTVDPDRLATAMRRIEQQSKRLKRFSEALLDLSRLQSGKLTLHRERVDLSSLARGVADSAQHSYPKREIQLRGEVTMPVLVDPLRLEQVLTNLMDNALKFSPSDSMIEIELEASEPDWVEAAVRDQGIGIPEDQRDRVFERFHQVDPAHRLSGMGIGLFISRQIVEMHGGSIRVEQPEDGGSRFVVRLPRQPADRLEAAPDGG